MCCNNFINRCNPCGNYGNYTTIRTIVGPQGPMGMPGPAGPTGATGPVGPQGPVGPSAVATLGVATLNNTTAETLTNVGDLITFDNTNAIQNASINGTLDTLTVTNAGTYLINYGFTETTGTGNSISLYINGTENATTRLAISNDGSSYNGSIILPLTAGSTISMGKSSGSTTITLPGDTMNAYINLVPILA